MLYLLLQHKTFLHWHRNLSLEKIFLSLYLKENQHVKCFTYVNDYRCECSASSVKLIWPVLSVQVFNCSLTTLVLSIAINFHPVRLTLCVAELIWGWATIYQRTGLFFTIIDLDLHVFSLSNLSYLIKH